MHRLVTRIASIAFVLSLLVPATSRAVELADGKLTVGGNASWAFLKTSANAYSGGDVDGDWNTAMFDLLAMAKPTDEVVLAAQLGFEPGGDIETGDGTKTELEWAFGEYRFSDLLRARAGKVKQPFGNYAELQYIGVARPFYNLPNSVYGPANVTASAFEGVAVTGEWLASTGFGVSYDAYGGALALETYEPWDVDPAAPDVLPTVEDESLENLVGGRVSLLTPWDVTFRLSGFGGKVEKDDGKLTYAVYGASVFHRGEKLWLSVEGFNSIEKGFENQISAYAEAAWFLTPKAQVAARYELTRTDLDAEGLAAEGVASVPTSFKNHDEVAVGFNWWFTPQVVVKASVHQVWGNRFTMSDNGDPQKDKALLFVAGTQFTF